jgi:hypothetical protein
MRVQYLPPTGPTIYYCAKATRLLPRCPSTISRQTWQHTNSKLLKPGEVSACEGADTTVERTRVGSGRDLGMQCRTLPHLSRHARKSTACSPPITLQQPPLTRHDLHVHALRPRQLVIPCTPISIIPSTRPRTYRTCSGSRRARSPWRPSTRARGRARRTGS